MTPLSHSLPLPLLLLLLTLPATVEQTYTMEPSQ